MVRDAEMHMAEDRTRRQDIDARNHADALAYQVERLLSEQGDQVPLHEKARAEQLVSDVRTALKEPAAGERIRTLSSDLEQLLHMLENRAHGRTDKQPQMAEHQQPMMKLWMLNIQRKNNCTHGHAAVPGGA